MISEVVFEHIVKKEEDAIDKLKKAGIVVGGSVLIVIFGLLLLYHPGLFALMLLGIIGVVYLEVYLLRSLNFEYEYSFVNGSLDVAKIINMSKRKHIASVDVKSCTAAGEYDANHFSAAAYSKVQNCCGSSAPQNAIYLVYRDNNGKSCCIVIEKDERMFKAMKPCFNATVYREGFLKK